MKAHIAEHAIDKPHYLATLMVVRVEVIFIAVFCVLSAGSFNLIDSIFVSYNTCIYFSRVSLLLGPKRENIKCSPPHSFTHTWLRACLIE